MIDSLRLTMATLLDLRRLLINHLQPLGLRPGARRDWSFAWLLGLLIAAPASHAALEQRTNLVQAILTDDSGQQIELIKRLSEANDPLVEQALTAWRQGGLFICETNETRVPFLLDAQTDSDGKAKAIRLADGEFIKSEKGEALTFQASDLTALDTTAKLRKAIKTTLDLFALADPQPRLRRDAATKLGQEQNADYLPFFVARVARETDKEVRKALTEAIALTQVADEKEPVRVAAIEQLGRMRSIPSLTFLQKLQADARADPKKFGETTLLAARGAVRLIENHMAWGDFVGTGFRGLSLAAVLLVAALGLAITFGLMGIINMAHGEIITVGAYTAYVTQNFFRDWFGASGAGFDCYFLAALMTSFLSAAGVGLVLERSVIRFLYKRLRRLADPGVAHENVRRLANPGGDAEPGDGGVHGRAHRACEHVHLRFRQRSGGHGGRLPLANRQCRPQPGSEPHRGLFHDRRARRRGQHLWYRLRLARRRRH